MGWQAHNYSCPSEPPPKIVRAFDWTQDTLSHTKTQLQSNTAFPLCIDPTYLANLRSSHAEIDAKQEAAAILSSIKYMQTTLRNKPVRNEMDKEDLSVADIIRVYPGQMTINLNIYPQAVQEQLVLLLANWSAREARYIEKDSAWNAKPTLVVYTQ